MESTEPKIEQENNKELSREELRDLIILAEQLFTMDNLDEQEEAKMSELLERAKNSVGVK